MKKLVLFMTFIVCGLASADAQNYDEYLSVARRHLAAGNIEDARKAYSVYRTLSDSRDLSFEDELAKASTISVKQRADKAYDNKEYEKSMKLYKLIPYDVDAQHAIGHMYMIGQGCEINYEEAKPWLRRAAEKGHSNAAYKLACIYGDEKNGKEYLKWMRVASENGYNHPLYCIAYAYYHGNSGLKQDAAEAFYWMKRAAEKDISQAMYDLGRMYYNGEGTLKDKNSAYYWMKKAADKGNKAAIELLKTHTF